MSTNNRNIVICGATGKQGGAVLESLVKAGGWDLVADYLEDEAIADYHLVNYWDPYMNQWLIQRIDIIPNTETIHDRRTDLSFLNAIEFENLIIQRKLNLQRIVSRYDETTELEMINRAIQQIPELSKGYI